MTERSKAREFAMQSVFQMEAQKDFEAPDIDRYLAREDMGDQEGYVRKLLTEVAAHIDVIDDMLNEYSRGWPTARMPKADLAIERTAAGEILYMDDVPKAVAINEAVELAKLYGTEQSPKFVNAVLGKIGQVNI